MNEILFFLNSIEDAFLKLTEMMHSYESKTLFGINNKNSFENKFNSFS